MVEQSARCLKWIWKLSIFQIDPKYLGKADDCLFFYFFNQIYMLLLVWFKMTLSGLQHNKMYGCKK